MRWPHRRKRINVVGELEALKLEFAPESWPTINSMIFYAMVGRDRRKLGRPYVERTRQMCLEELQQWRWINA